MKDYERHDGSGYPLGLLNEEYLSLLELSLLPICNIQSQMSPYSVVQIIVDDMDKKLDQKYMYDIFNKNPEFFG